MPVIEILVPLLNANEPEAKLVGIHVKNGQAVNKGDIIFSLETTKATADVEAPESGFIHLPENPVDLVSVGDLLGWITEKEGEVIEKKQTTIKQENHELLRITHPARNLAAQLGVDLSKLPTDNLVTESAIRNFVKNSRDALPDSLMVDPERSILVFGGGGHAKSVMEMVRSIGGYDIVGIVDDNIPAKTSIMNIPVLGTRLGLGEIRSLGVCFAANGVGGILDIHIRKRIFELMELEDFTFPALIHPRAMVEESAQISNGVQVFANAYIGSDSILHPRCMVNTNAVISHDCVINAFSHIAPGALLAGHVEVGEASLIGMGVTIAIGIKIGHNVRIGNGSIIYSDVPAKTIIPAGKIWAGEAK
jgi:sugar O-acyltransferase (sialic acid O-acetyltransferase NeuD family)